MTKFTIIIPTRERCGTLSSALDTCLRQDYDNLTILVSDNASTDNTREIVDEYQKRDSRVRYINPKCRLSMAHHWEFALSHVKDGMISIIGDDDGVLPRALKTADEMIAANPDIHAFHGSFVHFFYPDIAAADAGNLYLPLRTGIERCDARKTLQDLFRAKISYLFAPMVYYGFVDCSVIEQIIRKTGHPIHQSSPDVALAVAVTASVQEYVYSLSPYFIAGISRSSNGMSTLRPGADPSEGRRFQIENECFNAGMIPFSNFCVQPDTCFRVQEAGLVPSDEAIAWDTYIASAYRHCFTQGFTSERISDEIATLSRVSRHFGHSGLVENLDAHRAEFISGEYVPAALKDFNFRSPQYEQVLTFSQHGARDVAGVALVSAAVLAGAQPLYQELENLRYQPIMQTVINKVRRRLGLPS